LKIVPLVEGASTIGREAAGIDVEGGKRREVNIGKEEERTEFDDVAGATDDGTWLDGMMGEKGARVGIVDMECVRGGSVRLVAEGGAFEKFRFVREENAILMIIICVVVFKK